MLRTGGVQRCAGQVGAREAKLTRSGRRLALILAIAVLGAMFGGVATVNAAEPTPTPKPVNTEAPKLTGTPTVGQTLSCSQGVWANEPDGVHLRVAARQHPDRGADGEHVHRAERRSWPVDHLPGHRQQLER